MTRPLGLLVLAVTVVALLAAACTGGGSEAGDEGAPGGGDAEQGADAVLTIYSGRAEELVGPALDDFTAQTGIEVEVRYGDTAEMAQAILEEGDRSPADVFFGQDAGALGALQREGRLVEVADDLLDRVDPRFRSAEGRWVGTSGRARVIAYNTEALDEAAVPDSVLDLTDPDWEGRVGWSPPNGSFQAFVTAMRTELGDDTTREWVEGMIANDAVEFENNTAIVEALAAGEIDLGLVNHYYLYRFLDEDPDFPVANHYLAGDDVGALINIAGLGILDTTKDADAAEQLMDFMLDDDAQAYFAQETYEHPLVPGVEGDPRVPGIDEIDSPDIDLSDLEDLEGTVQLLTDAGAL